MSFHLGKPILVMIFLALAAGLLSMATRRQDPRADVEMWLFSDTDYRFSVTGSDGEPSLVEDFEKQTGLSARVKIIQHRALNTRLSNLLMNGTRWPELPDVISTEVSSVGRYFRPPVDEVGFYPLNAFIERDGWSDKFVAARLAVWSKDGVIFGIPKDVHPVVIAYNDEMFRAAGVDLGSSATWEEFIENALRFQAYWRAQGRPRVWALEVSESNASTLVALLLQRGVSLVDEHGELRLTDEKTLDTLVRVCSMLRGPRRIASSASGGNEAYSQDLGSGYVNAMLCADWRLQYLKDNAPASLRGKMKIMPLPAWRDSPYRTSTAGGSMAGIPRRARDPEASWKMIQSLYLSERAIQLRSRNGFAIPAVRSMWGSLDHESLDPFFSDQPVGRMLIELAGGVPPRYVSPASNAAEIELATVLIRAVRFAESNDEAALRDYCRTLLAESTERLKRQIAHGSFEP